MYKKSKKKGLIVFVVFLVFLFYLVLDNRSDNPTTLFNPLILEVEASSDCDCSGGSEYGGSCQTGYCPGIWENPCDGCNSYGWRCTGTGGSPEFGLSCACGPCGCGGEIGCDGTCEGQDPAPADYGQSCGNCGWIDCGGACIGQGCAPGSNQCVNSRYQTCSSSCSWSNAGTDADGDGVDAQCGDSLCDNVAGITDSTRQTTETSCSDGVDNDCDGFTDNQDSDCCTDITRECKQYTQEEFEAVHSSYYEDGQTTYAGSINSQRMGNNYYACQPKSNDIVCCANLSSCVYDGVCYPDRYKGDIDGDGIQEICIASSPGQWVDEFETNCANGIDDDLDGLTDCQDSDCAGSISGNVKNTDNENIDGAQIDTIQGSTVQYTTFTNLSGNYNIDDVLCGTYNMIASAESYVSSTKIDVNLSPRTSITEDFILVLGTTCEADCTYAGDNTLHAECDGINGCSFYDNIAKQVCNLAQPGWKRSYNETHTIICPSGPLNEKTITAAKVTCEEENLIKITKIVVYKGKPVNMVITVCG